MLSAEVSSYSYCVKIREQNKIAVKISIRLLKVDCIFSKLSCHRDHVEPT